VPVTKTPKDVGSAGGPVEFLLPPRASPQHGEMDPDQDGDGLFTIDRPALQPTCLPTLDGPTGC